VIWFDEDTNQTWTEAEFRHAMAHHYLKEAYVSLPMCEKDDSGVCQSVKRIPPEMDIPL
jgi:hypothetical protein